MPFSNKTITKHAGFSLVELMVAVVIGLIGTLVMFQVFAVSEGQKRTTVSGGDAQQNSAIALFTLEYDLRNTGNGFANLTALGLPVFSWNNATGTPNPPRFFRPVLIRPLANGSDAIDISYSTFTGLTTPVRLNTNWNPAVVPAPDISLANGAGFNDGDILVICPEQLPAPPANNACIIAQGTDVPTQNTVTIGAPPALFVLDGQNTTSRWNPAAGFTAALATGGNAIPALYQGDGQTQSVVFNLGPELVNRTYSVVNDRLMQTDANGANQEFADGIVGLRAQYGLDTDGDGAVDSWADPRGSDVNPAVAFTPNHPSFLVATPAQIAAGWRMVAAIRVAIVSRSGNKEKTVVESRSLIPLWSNPAANAVPGPSFAVTGTDAQNYRYQVAESIVPFRNVSWRPASSP
jgi:type IV pilus assembly protein PilW